MLIVVLHTHTHTHTHTETHLTSRSVWWHFTGIYDLYKWWKVSVLRALLHSDAAPLNLSVADLTRNIESDVTRAGNICQSDVISAFSLIWWESTLQILAVFGVKDHSYSPWCKDQRWSGSSCSFYFFKIHFWSFLLCLWWRQLERVREGRRERDGMTRCKGPSGYFKFWLTFT